MTGDDDLHRRTNKFFFGVPSTSRARTKEQLEKGRVYKEIELAQERKEIREATREVWEDD